MNYIDWGKQYLDEAKALKEHIAVTRRKLKNANTIDKRDIRYRIVTLYQIYRELKSTGKLLIEYGEKLNGKSY